MVDGRRCTELWIPVEEGRAALSVASFAAHSAARIDEATKTRQNRASFVVALRFMHDPFGH